MEPNTLSQAFARGLDVYYSAPCTLYSVQKVLLLGWQPGSLAAWHSAQGNIVSRKMVCRWWSCNWTAGRTLITVKRYYYRVATPTTMKALTEILKHPVDIYFRWQGKKNTMLLEVGVERRISSHRTRGGRYHSHEQDDRVAITARSRVHAVSARRKQLIISFGVPIGHNFPHVQG